jgi:6-pyruvoyltetrahydropterin/6-carboxytetrahydropterin synthase
MLPHYKDKKNLYSYPQNYTTPDLTVIKDEPSHIHEMYEGFIIVDFVPTSENISAWLLEIVQKKMSGIDIKVSHLEFFETPKSKSTVYLD